MNYLGLSLLSLLSVLPLAAHAAASSASSPPLHLGHAQTRAPAVSSPELLHRPLPRTELAATGVSTAPIELRPSLSRRALQSVVEAPVENTSGASAADGRFRFERRGSAFRVLQRSYRDMCDNVSGKVWDDPNGRRIKFDVAGKPGVAVEIPLR